MEVRAFQGGLSFLLPHTVKPLGVTPAEPGVYLNKLRLFRGNESFRPLGSREDQQVNRGEFGYVDAENRVICRLDSLQADFSKVTTDTTQALLIVESTTAHDTEQLEKDFAATRAVLDRYCGAKAEVVAFPE